MMKTVIVIFKPPSIIDVTLVDSQKRLNVCTKNPLEGYWSGRRELDDVVALVFSNIGIPKGYLYVHYNGTTSL